MRTRYYLNITITFLLLALLYSCHRRHDVPLHPALQRADSLMQQHPDSALALLSRFNSRSFKDSSDKAAYALLRTNADDKNYIDHTNDSLIGLAVRYYDRHGDDLQKAEAHYYLGRIYQNAGAKRRSITEFMLSIGLYKKGKYLISEYRAKSNLANIILDDGYFLEADSLYKDILHYDKSRHSYDEIAIDYKCLGDISVMKARYKEAEFYYLNSLKICRNSRNKYIEGDVLSAISYLYVYMKQWNNALFYARLGEIKAYEANLVFKFYLVKGNAFYYMHQMDSADYYLHKIILNSQNTLLLRDAYWLLSELAKNQHDSKTQAHYQRLYIINKENLDSTVSSRSVAEHYKDLLYKKDISYYQSSFSILKYLIVGGLAIFIIIILYLYNRRARIKKNIQKLNKQCIRLSNKSFQLNEQINSKDAEIKELKIREEETHKSLEQYKIITNEMASLLKERERLQEKQKDLLREKELFVKSINGKYPLFECFVQTEVYMKLQELIEYNVNNPDNKQRIDIRLSEKILVTIQGIDPIFFENLNQLFLDEYTKDDDMLFCCLLRLNYKFKDISNIYGLTLDAIYKKEKVIISRIKFKESGKLQDIIHNI